MIFRDRIVRLRAPQITAGYGNTRRDWASATSTLYPATVGPVSTDEDVVDQNRVTGRWRMFLPATADVVATDRIVYDGDTYDIDGDVERWKRHGRLHHLEAVLLKVTQA